MSATPCMRRSGWLSASAQGLSVFRVRRAAMSRALIGLHAFVLMLCFGFLPKSASACSCWFELGPEFWLHNDAVVVATALETNVGVREPVDHARRYHADFLVSEVVFGMLVPGSVIQVDGERGGCSLGAIRGMIYLMRLNRTDGEWSAGHCGVDWLGVEGEPEPWMSELDFGYARERLLRAREVLGRASSGPVEESMQ